jgi:hypothetical protein
MPKKRKGAPTAEALIRAAEQSAAGRKEYLRRGTTWFAESSRRTVDLDFTRELPVAPIDTVDLIDTLHMFDADITASMNLRLCYSEAEVDEWLRTETERFRAMFACDE